jgi:hypothetical protein
MQLSMVLTVSPQAVGCLGPMQWFTKQNAKLFFAGTNLQNQNF